MSFPRLWRVENMNKQQFVSRLMHVHQKLCLVRQKLYCVFFSKVTSLFAKKIVHIEVFEALYSVTHLEILEAGYYTEVHL